MFAIYNPNPDPWRDGEPDFGYWQFCRRIRRKHQAWQTPAALGIIPSVPFPTLGEV